MDTGSDLGLRKREMILVTALTAVAAVLRLWTIADWSFKGDEFGTLEWIARSPGEILSHYTQQLTMHLYLLGLRGWAALFGDSAWSLKLPSALVGVALVPLVFEIGRRWFGKEVAFVAAALVALSPLLIRYSRVARAYECVVFLSCLLFWVEGLAWSRGGVVWLLSLTLALFGLLATSLSAAPVACVLGVHAGLRLFQREERGRRWQRTAMLVLPAGLAALAVWSFYRQAMPEILVFREQWTGSGWRVDWVLPTYGHVHRSLRSIAWLLMVLGVWEGWRRHRERAQLTLLWATLPWLFFVGVGSTHAVSAFDRFVIATVPAQLLLVALGVWRIAGWARGAQRSIVGVVLSLGLLGFLVAHPSYWTRIEQKMARPFEEGLAWVSQKSRSKKDVLVLGVLGIEKPDQLEWDLELPPMIPFANATSARPDQRGRLFLLSKRFSGAETRWSEFFEVRVIEEEDAKGALVVLRGAKATAGGEAYREALTRYLEVCADIGVEGRLSVDPVRHHRRMHQVCKSLTQLAGQAADHEGRRRWEALAGEHKQRAAELQKGAER